MYIGLHVKYRLFMADFRKILKFHNILPVGAELFHGDGETCSSNSRVSPFCEGSYKRSVPKPAIFPVHLLS